MCVFVNTLYMCNVCYIYYMYVCISVICRPSCYSILQLVAFVNQLHYFVFLTSAFFIVFSNFSVTAGYESTIHIFCLNTYSLYHLILDFYTNFYLDVFLEIFPFAFVIMRCLDLFLFYV